MSRTQLALISTLALIGCDGETPPPDEDAGVDGGGGGGCVGAADGASCGSALICIAEECVASTCGDGYLDEAMAEECDDGNTLAFDGCEPLTCTFTCADDSACIDTAVCNGVETCTDHVCAAGTPPANGTDCTLAAGGAGVCRATVCVAAGCGNGVPDGAEECDDSNDVDGDGCDVDCTFSCNEDLDCADGDVCNGDETCEVATHACVLGAALDCVDGDDCTADQCHSIDGCENPLIDADMDGHAAESLGACGDDCNDMRADVYTGAEELCDGIDNNCNFDVDEMAPTWYIDCDSDGFAATTDGSRMGCTEPASGATGCGGRWTTVRPVSTGTTDCLDTNANVFPGQTAYFTTAIPGMAGNYDYNCDGIESRQYGCGPSGGGCASGCPGGYAPYDASTNPNGCRFTCILGSCFVTSYPDCGQSASYTTCTRFGTGCLPLRPSARTQACR